MIMVIRNVKRGHEGLESDVSQASLCRHPARIRAESKAAVTADRAAAPS